MYLRKIVWLSLSTLLLSACPEYQSDVTEERDAGAQAASDAATTGDAASAPDLAFDASGPGEFALVSASFQVTEAEGLIEIMVLRRGGTGGQATVWYTSRYLGNDPSVPNPAEDVSFGNGNDYEGIFGELIFADGVDRRTFQVLQHDDTVEDGDRVFNVELYDSSIPLGEPSVATVTIIDDEGATGVDAGAESDAHVGADAATGTDAGDEPDCAATGGARCLYVAVNGDDSAAGTIAAPLKTFQAALVQAAAGDIVYARGGTYGRDNATVASGLRLPQSQFPPPCDPGQTAADGYCQVPRLAFAAIRSWNGYPLPGEDGYDVASGEPGRPITLRAFPGERPVLDMHALEHSPAIEAAMIMSQKRAIQINRSHWVISGFEVIGGNIDMGGNIVDITIQGCDIHDLIRDGGDNPGLVRLNRGPEQVRILNNRLHAIYDHETPGVWGSGAEDAQHFGAVTTLSGETYGGTDDTGAVEIRGNEIFNVPQVFFFKNAQRGPIDIVDNHIYDSGRLALNIASNVRFAGNLIHGVAQGIVRQGLGFTELGTSDPAVLAVDGQNLTVEHNTIVGLQGTLVNSKHGVGHLLQHNVIYGLPGVTAGANWDTGSYIKVGEDTPVEESRLHDMSSDNNCFIVPDAGFQFVARYLSSGVEHHDLAAGQSLFGFDLLSTVVVTSDAAEVFMDPAGGDYALLGAIDCAGAGHTAAP